MGSPNKDYYAVLELDKRADQDAIKKAYRRLALKYHPDRNKGNEKEAEAKFREIHEAYAVLSDPQKKEEYDTYGINGMRNRPVYQNSSDLFNMFNSFFGGNPFSHRNQFFSSPRSAFGDNGFGNGFRSSGFNDFGFQPHFRPHPFDSFESTSSSSSSSSSRSNSHTNNMKQHKVRMNVNVGFRDSVMGCSRQISLEYSAKCSICAGTGAASGRISDTLCGKCGGAGRIRDTRSGMSITMTCVDCGGGGRRITTPCPACLGSGKMPKVHQEELVVPPGVSPNSTVKRIISPEDNDEEIYELTIEYKVETHPFFVRKGIDVHLDVPITYTQAVLGDTIQVPSIYGGTTEVQIPPGSQPMGEFVLLGQGFFNLDGNGQGDMVLRWILEVPKVLTPDERKVLTQLSQLEQGSLAEKRVQFLQFLIDWDAETL